MKEIENTASAFTHGGVFHADDVFSAALLRLMNPDIVIKRGNQVPEGFDGLIFDIGGGEFDHHQADKRVRDNGVPYAAFGLLWERYGSIFMEEKDASTFDKQVVQPMDISDNTGSYNELSNCVSDFHPKWDEEDPDMDAAFFRAVDWAREILDRRFSYASSKYKARKIILELAEKNRGEILVLDRSMPWRGVLERTDILYVVFPSLRGGYIVQAVGEPGRENNPKLPFPKEWRGKKPEELVRVTGIASFAFCHMAGFLCAVGEFEDAMKVAEDSLRRNG